MVIKMNLTNDEKHYNTLANYYFNKYHEKVAKISLNAGFSCPNKDGKKDMVAVPTVLNQVPVILPEVLTMT